MPRGGVDFFGADLQTRSGGLFEQNSEETVSKFVCKCGHVISDLKYPSPSSSTMLSETELVNVLSYAGELLRGLRHADATGRRKEWVGSTFDAGYPDDASDSEILEDALSRRIAELAVCVVNCNSCGRVHMQARPGAKEYSSFVPEG